MSSPEVSSGYVEAAGADHRNVDPTPGRLAFRVAWAQPETFQFVHLNDITAVESVAYLIKYDSVHGAYRGWHQEGIVRWLGPHPST